MTWLVILIVLIVLIIGWISDVFSQWDKGKKEKQNFENRRNQKYANRNTDINLILFDRNLDIIEQFAVSIRNSHSYNQYYMQNQVRDCLNEICLAENRADLAPQHDYLSVWRNKANPEWLLLSNQIQEVFENRKNQLNRLEEKIQNARLKLNNRKETRKNPLEMREIHESSAKRPIELSDISLILTPNNPAWFEKELILSEFLEPDNDFSLFEVDTEEDFELAEKLNKDIINFNKQLKADSLEQLKSKVYFEDLTKNYKNNDKESVVKRVNHIVNDLHFPNSLPNRWNTDYDSEQNIAIIELQLPDVVHNQIFKEVMLKSGSIKKPLNQKEAREHVPNIQPSIIIRVAYEIFRNDVDNIIKLLVVNGWVEFNDPNTGVITKTYTSSLAVTRDQVLHLDISKLDPISAFHHLKGKSAGRLIDIVPVIPIMSLNKKDNRFIETKEILNTLNYETNLAAMDWQDFENLIAQLFEKEFSKEGVEVKVTQASRDRGVDAVIFDPDPIKGGKYIVQAKRYTNTVDVSAVRDLCAVVQKEGASRGILVTTSNYGSDAYAFAQNEPITLLNGAELLGLLAKHNYKFRINLAEARKLNSVAIEYSK